MRFQRLEDLRIDADKTQEEIANILDCKREVYRRYEKTEDMKKEFMKSPSGH